MVIEEFPAGLNAKIVIDDIERTRLADLGIQDPEAQNRIYKSMGQLVAGLDAPDVAEEI
jgi:hypothetical protein